jgi:adenosylcobinamide-GDP ribazoletransferase
MLAAFAVKEDHKKAVVVLVLLSALGFAGWICFTFPHGIAGPALCLPVTIWYRRMAKKHFGGVTGDTTGYYLQITELALIAGLLIGGVVSQWL